MFNLLKESSFNEIIVSTATNKGMNAAIVEKDFWVCLTLNYLFHDSRWKNQIAFKGGTCLSKVYEFIERFSEDIDLILDWRVLGYSSKEPLDERSNTKQIKFNDNLKEKLFKFLKDEFVPEFKKGLSQKIGINCDIEIEKDNPGVVVFNYPHSHNDTSILNAIRIEIGALASWIPLREATIKPFIAEVYPNAMSQSECKLLATTPERTFWEKATILHHESFRPEYSKMPDRYSRHYYDIYCMCKKGVDKIAISKPDLLEEVALFKNKFYPRGWARYDLARFGTLSLLPAEHSLERLKRDYEKMRKMIYGEYPSFEQILEVIKNLEKEINEVRCE